VKYLMMVCSDGEASAESGEVIRREIPNWLAETERRGVRLAGHPLDEPESGVAVRVRDSETLVTDGPFAETKELAGFDVIDCENLDEAIDIAAKHPVAWFHAIEVRPFAPCGAVDAQADDLSDVLAPVNSAAPAGTSRHMLLMHVDGIPASDAEEAAIVRDGDSWHDERKRTGELIFAHALAPPEAATTVRVRDGETLLSDGPFAESKEFIAGFAIVDVPDRDAAISAAAAHPLASYHYIDVRPFAEYPSGDDTVGE